MSLYLFDLCMEKLTVMIQNKVDLGIWKPIKIIRDDPSISHHFFMNDVLLFL